MPYIRKLGGNQGLIRGDITSIYRTIEGLPVGRTVTKAWLMVKTSVSVIDASATISKTITTTNVAGTGQIEDDGTTDSTAILRFDLTNANTIAVTAETVHLYSIQIKLDNSDIVEIETGQAVWRAEVIITSS